MNIFDLLIVQPIFNLLIGLYSIIPGNDFGVAVILFTIVVRFAMYPLLKRQLHQTKIMRQLQPKLAKIKKDAKGNRQLESMQMLELYKKHGVNPFRSILILIIQIPIFIALYLVIQIFTLHRDQIAKFTYDFMEGIEPIRQLIERPKEFNEMLFGVVNLTQPAFSNSGVHVSLVLLAIAAAYAQYILGKQTLPNSGKTKRLRDIMAEAAEGKQVDQAEINNITMTKMVKMLPIFMFFVMTAVPGAIALYYGVSNIVAVFQQRHLLNQDIEELEELADEPVVKQTKPKETNVTRIVAKPSRRKK